MKRVAFATAAAAACLTAVPALAQTAPGVGAYGTLGYSQHDDRGAGLGTAQGRLGYKFTPMLGVEAEGAIGVDTDRGPVGQAKVKRSVGAYAVGAAPVSPNLELFGRVGYGNTRFKDSAP